MSFQLFYTDYDKDEHVRSDEPKSANADEIVECMNRVLTEPDNFVGIVDADDVTLQFMVEDDGSVVVDVPVHDKNGSFTKQADLSTCFAIVNKLQDTIVVDAIEGLEFKAW